MDNIRIAIWGTELYGVFLKTAYDILKPEGLEFVCYSTDNPDGLESQDGLPVYSTEKLGELHKSGDIHAVILAVHHSKLHQLACKLMLQGIFDLYYLPHYYYELSADDFTFDYLERIDTPKPRLDYLEFHLADHCNLNCKGCAHLSNIAEPRLADLNQYIKDMERLRELFWGIERIRLMGGEPLLNEQLPDFINVTREVFPDADIHVVTNGLLLNIDHGSLLRTMHDKDCSFNISQYPPSANRLKQIRALCRFYDVNCLVSDPIGVFRTCIDPDGTQTPAEAYSKCDVTHCTFLREGTLSNCIMPYILPRFSELYGKNMAAGESDIINIHDPAIDGITILEKLHSPIESCRYCNPSDTFVYPWDTAPKGKAKPADWVYKSYGRSTD
ncbi:MAG: radical SAM protein [Lachnospiraceae bacterium]|nr:radical SAM protein [Lachnospiraceae bacterium]